jgi:hypothetical protein
MQECRLEGRQEGRQAGGRQVGRQAGMKVVFEGFRDERVSACSLQGRTKNYCRAGDVLWCKMFASIEHCVKI